MRDIRPPSWLELESVLPLEAEPGVTSRRDGHDPERRDPAARVSRIYHSAVAAAPGHEVEACLAHCRHRRHRGEHGSDERTKITA